MPQGEYSTLTPKIYVTLSQYERETGNRITSFNEAPALAALVAAGELPPVEDRLPDEPQVIEPLERIGTYGGDLKALASGARAVDVDTRRPRLQMLVQYDLKEILPNIPLAYEFNDDASALTLHLRNGMRWSDGEPLTSADFLFWYEDVASNEELTPANRGIWRPGGELVKVEAVDDLTVRFRFAVPHPLILHFLSMKRSDSRSFPVDPKHYLSQFHIKYNAKAGDLAKEQGHDTWVELFRAHDVRNVQDDMDFSAAHDVGNRQRRTRWGNHYFARNPYFWKIDTAGNQLPYMDRQVRVVIENQEVANLRSMAGEVHYSSFYLTLENYPLYRESEAKGDYRTVLLVNPRSSIQAYQLNLTYNEDPVLRELFNDIRFRQAMSLALNRDQINEVALLGRAIPRAWSVDPSNPFYEDWMGEYFTDYDPDRANAILDEIGLQWDADGEFRLRPDGKRLDIILEYRPTEGPKATINQLASSHWKAIGGQRGREGRLRRVGADPDAGQPDADVVAPLRSQHRSRHVHRVPRLVRAAMVRFRAAVGRVVRHRRRPRRGAAGRREAHLRGGRGAGQDPIGHRALAGAGPGYRRQQRARALQHRYGRHYLPAGDLPQLAGERAARGRVRG